MTRAPARPTSRPVARLAAALAATTVALGAGPAWAEFRLNIVHLNDPHSRIEPINRFDSTCSAEDDAAGECFGGFARLKTAIEQRREALDGPTIVVSAGDHFQGSLFYTTYKGAGEAEMAEAIGVDVLTLGNHEFDDGDAELGAFLDGVSFPVLGANVDASRSDAVDGRIDPYVIAEFDDGEGGTERVAFVGVVASDTPETSSPGPNIDISDDLTALREAVDEITDKGVNKIIAVTHVGLPRDRELAEAVPEIDLIIGGHSHTLLSNEPEEVADGAPPYPVVVNGDTPIVQAYAYGKYLGESVLRFDDEGNLASLAGDPILVDASFAKDEALEARIQEMLGPIEELKAMVVGETTTAIDGDRSSCRAGECEMGNLVADAMLDRVADQGIDVAIQNGGGLRASIDAGEVTMGEVLTVLPFQNTLATFELTGADIVASLEQGVSEIEEGAGRFPQVAGMSYAFDPTAEVGSRISDVRVGGEPIDPDATYGVATNNFMRGGGDGYELFETEGRNAYDFGPGLEQVVADYIAAEGPITPTIDGRITDVSAAGAMTEEASSGEVMTGEDAAKADMDVAEEDVAAELVEGETTAEAVAAINDAVEGTSDLQPLASPPTIAAGEAGAEVVQVGKAVPADGTVPADEADAASATGVTDAEPMSADAMPTEGGDASTDQAMADEASDVTETIVEATPQPTADTGAVKDTVEEVTGEEATDTTADAASAINEAVEAVTDLAPLSDAPVIESAEVTTDDATDAAETIVVVTPQPTAETEAVQDAVESAATDAAVEAAPAPSADTDAVQGAVEEVTDTTADAASAINEAVEAVTDLVPLSDAPVIETPIVEATADDATDAAETIVEVTPQPTAETEAVRDAVESAAADAAVEAAPAPSADTEAVQDAVEAATDASDGAVAPSTGEAPTEIASTTDAVVTDTAATDEASETETVIADGADAEPRTYTVGDGDTFWSIAGEVYGDPRLFTLLVEANEENARRLQIGDEIVVPARPQ